MSDDNKNNSSSKKCPILHHPTRAGALSNRKFNLSFFFLKKKAFTIHSLQNLC